MNAIISAKRSDMLGSKMYIYGFDAKTGLPIETHPCMLCKKMIINAGIELVIVSTPYENQCRAESSEQYIKEINEMNTK